MNQQMGVNVPASGRFYILLDEGGNFDFSPKGTRFFTLTAITAQRPFAWETDLLTLKYDELERGIDSECFHASEDEQLTRNAVFEVINRHLSTVQIDALIVEKSKTHPNLRQAEHLYPQMLGHLLRFVVRHHVRPPAQLAYSEVIVITDSIPVRAKRKAIEKAVKETLGRRLGARIPFRVLHHDSKSCLTLQVADYCNWAIYRKWDGGDDRSYRAIRAAIRSEFDIFRLGNVRYY